MRTPNASLHFDRTRIDLLRWPPMSLHEVTGWIVTYDICEPRRLSAVHRRLKRHGIPLQYSVFLVMASSARIQSLMLELESIIDTSVDDVRGYRYAAGAECHTLGPAILPEGVLFVDNSSRARLLQPTRSRVKV